MDPGLDEDKTELGVLVLPVNLEVLAHCDRLFDEVPEVLRDGWRESYPQTKGMCVMYTSTAGKRKEGERKTDSA